MTGKIQRQNVYQLVADQLLEDLASSGLAVGDQIPTERELTVRYGVGRSSVREAMRKLESHGVIRPTGQGGYVLGTQDAAIGESFQLLLQLGHASLAEITELREVLEVPAARAAAERRTPENLADMQRAIDAMELAADESREDVLTADLAFHVAIAEATNNGAIAAAARGIRHALQEALRSNYWSSDVAVAQHRAIGEAIAQGDPAAAGTAMQEHLDWIKTILPQEERAVTT
jgi:DNA-binding FadR family transcriptional regulator